MNAKRAVAVVAAIAVIAAAWLVRTRVIDDGTATDPSVGTVVCVRDLAEICRAVEDALEVDVRIESVDETLDTWGSADQIPSEVWITMAPFPAMVDSLRENARLTPADAQVETVASSPLTLVANADAAVAVTGDCGDPVDWTCLGSDATDVTVGFAPFPHTAIGQLGVTTAVLGFGQPSGTAFAVWAKQISQASDNRAGSGTSVATIQTRPSFDVAVGAEAELTAANAARFTLLTPSDSATIDVVVATPAGTSTPGGLIDALRDELTNSGWADPGTASTTPSADAMLAVREVWKDYL